MRRSQKKPEKILMYSVPDGGIGQYTYCLCRALQARGIDVTTLIHSRPQYDLAALPHQHLVKPKISLDAKSWKRLPDLGMIWQEAQSKRIFHSQWTLGAAFDRLSWRMLKAAGKRIVYTAHDVLPHERIPKDIAHSVWLYRHADAVIVHGQALKQTLLEISGINPAKVHVMPHGNFHPIADFYMQAADGRPWDRTRARDSFGLAPQDRVVLFFGFIRPYKGLDTLIGACQCIQKQENGGNLRLLIAGQTLADFWKAHDYADKIKGAGLEAQTMYAIQYIPMEEVARYFLAADVVALPYKSGSQSGIVQMASAYSRPVVVTDVGSISEVVEEGITGTIVPPDNPAAFADALMPLLNQPDLAERMGRQGRLRGETDFSWERIAAQTEAIYAQL